MKGASRLSGAGDTDPLVLASIRQNEPENEEFVLYGDDKAIAGAGAGRGRAVVTLQSSRDCGPAPAPAEIHHRWVT